MDDLGSFVDFPSPANSMYYAYGDSEPYLSESQSPNNSTVSPPRTASRKPAILTTANPSTTQHQQDAADTPAPETRKASPPTHQTNKSQQQPSASAKTATKTPRQPCYP